MGISVYWSTGSGITVKEDNWFITHPEYYVRESFSLMMHPSEFWNTEYEGWRIAFFVVYVYVQDT